MALMKDPISHILNPSSSIIHLAHLFPQRSESPMLHIQSQMRSLSCLIWVGT